MAMTKTLEEFLFLVLYGFICGSMSIWFASRK